MSTQIVSIGHINVLGGPAGQTSRVITDEDIAWRAHRSCPRGSAGCGFRGVEVSQVDAKGDVTVSLMCAPGSSCGPTGRCQTSSERLQISLNRLRASKPPVTSPQKKVS